MSAPVIPNPIPQFHDIPQSGQPKDVFDLNADDFLGEQLPAFVAYMNGWTDAANAFGVYLGDLAAATYNAANFHGEWAELSGPINMPALVHHNGYVWVLQQNMNEASAVEPGTDETYWKYIYDVFGIAYADVGSGGSVLAQGDIATLQEYLTATSGKVLGAEAMLNGLAPVEILSPPNNIQLDCSQAVNFVIHTTGDHVIDPLVNPIKGLSGFIEVVVVDPAHSIEFSAAAEFGAGAGAGGYTTADGAIPDLSSSVENTKHVISYVVTSNLTTLISVIRNVREVV